MNLKVVDTTAPLSFFEPHGYYIVGDKIFNHKVFALQEATRSKQEPQWIFNNRVYDKLNWSETSGVDLPELYRIRAQQLRDKYDYLILYFSGGADSTNVLMTFLENNIRLDEILIYWPRKFSEKTYTPNLSSESENLVSEWDYTISPRLEWIRKNYPNLKITVLDFSDDLLTEEYFDDTVVVAEKHNYVAIKRSRACDKLVIDRMDKFGNVGQIVGSSPVELSLVNREAMIVWFYDVGTTPGPKKDYMITGHPRNYELFYWTPDLPEIPRDQAHALLKHFRMNPLLVNILDNFTISPNKVLVQDSKGDPELFRLIRKDIIYPGRNHNYFQAHKSPSTHSINEMHNWFYKTDQSKAMTDSWISAVLSQQSLIDPKYCIYKDGFVSSYKVFTSKFYVVGKI